MEDKKKESEFGKGFIYCLVLWSMHFSNDRFQKLGNLKFLIDKSDEERNIILKREVQYGHEMDYAIFQWEKILPIYKTPERLLANEINLWANGASDHLYEIECPKKFEKTELKNKIDTLKKLGLEMGHGHGLYGENCDWDHLKQIQELTKEIILLSDTLLGVIPIEAQWGEL